MKKIILSLFMIGIMVMMVGGVVSADVAEPEFYWAMNVEADFAGSGGSQMYRFETPYWGWSSINYYSDTIDSLGLFDETNFELGGAPYEFDLMKSYNGENEDVLWELEYVPESVPSLSHSAVQLIISKDGITPVYQLGCNFEACPFYKPYNNGWGAATGELPEGMNVYGNLGDESFQIILDKYNLATQEDWTVSEGENSIDALDEVDTEITINTNGEVDVTIVEETDPEAFPDGLKSAGKIINVEVSDEGAVEWPIYIRIYYTQDDLDSVGLTENQLVGIFFWDGDSWEFYDDTGVVTDYSDGDYIGYFWVNADHLTPIAGGGDTNAPEIDEESINVDPEHPQVGMTVEICADVTDDTGVASVKLSCETSDEVTLGGQIMANAGGNTYCGTANDLSPSDGTTVDCSITAKDLGDNSDTATVSQFVFDGLAPTADLTGGESLDEGEEGSYDASGSSDTVDDSLTYAWDFDYDGEVFNAYEGYEDSTESYTWNDNRIYVVAVRVTDDADFIDIETLTVTVSDLSPTASFTSDSPKNEGEVMSFTDASTSYDSIVSWSWDFGDDEGESNLQNPTYTYLEDGEYEVSLTVVDSDGSEDTFTEGVIVNDLNPKASLTGSEVLDEGEEGNFDASDSSPSPDGIMSYEWDWDYEEDNFVASGDTGVEQSHIYNDNGIYLVAVKVNDDDSYDIATFEVTVNNVAPSFDNLPASEIAFVNEVFYFDVDATDVDDLIYALVSYPVGMGINAGTGEITWTPSEEQYGDYEIIVSVDDGAVSVEGTLNLRVNSFGINLEKGWNLFSIPLVPEDTDTNSVLPSEISSNAVKIWAYREGDWDYTTPNTGGATWDHSPGKLKNIEPGYGYYIKMDEGGGTIYHDGEKYYRVGEGLPMPPQVVLTTGWNLIGHYGMNNVEKGEETFDLSGGVLTDLANVNLLSQEGLPVSTLIPGEGYWAFITGQDDLWYAPSEADYSEDIE